VPQPTERFIHRNTGKPCPEAGVAAKTLQMREGADVGLLDNVLGLVIVSQDAADDPVEPAVVPLHDGAKRSVVARARAPDQFGVIEGRQIGVWSEFGLHASFLCCRIGWNGEEKVPGLYPEIAKNAGANSLAG
jgi:hypothetical protein